MPDNNEPIRIGRISRSIEKSLDISLTGSVLIYMDAESLDRLAEKRPTDYLAYIGEIASILKDPDFVGFEPEKERFVFVRSYFRPATWTFVYLTIVKRGRPSQWMFAGINASPALAVPRTYDNIAFTRVSDHKTISK